MDTHLSPPAKGKKFRSYSGTKRKEDQQGYSTSSSNNEELAEGKNTMLHSKNNDGFNHSQKQKISSRSQSGKTLKCKKERQQHF